MLNPAVYEQSLAPSVRFFSHFHTVNSALLPPHSLHCALPSSYPFILGLTTIVQELKYRNGVRAFENLLIRRIMASRSKWLSTRSQSIIPKLYRSFARSRVASRRFCFSIICFGLVLSKLVHIWSHFNSLPPAKLCLWGLTFFAQDLALIHILRTLVQPTHLKSWRILAIIGMTVALSTR